MRLDHFDLIARFYDRVFHFLSPERLMSLLHAQPSERILDIGGGTGRVSQTFGDDYAGRRAPLVVVAIPPGEC